MKDPMKETRLQRAERENMQWREWSEVVIKILDHYRLVIK